MKRIVLLSALVLAGCAGLDPDAAYPDLDCRATMNADPAVKRSYSDISDTGDKIREKEMIKREAYNRCLRATGKIRGGGVQPVKPTF